MLRFIKSSVFLTSWFILFMFFHSCENDTLSPAQAESFLKLFGSYKADAGYDVRSLSDGGYALTGSVSTENRGKELIIIRTDKFGNEIWETKQTGGLSDDAGYSIHALDDGGFVILGYTTIIPGTGLAPVRNMYLVRTSVTGDTLWTRNYGGNKNDVGYDMKITSDGGFILIGYTESFGQGGKDVWLVKTNSQGDTLWTRTHGGVNDDVGKCIIETSYGYIFTGYTRSYSEQGQANANIFVVKVNTLGKEIFPFTFGGMNDDFGEVILALPGGGYILAGYGNSTQTGTINAVLLKIEEQISQVSWSKNYGGQINHTVSALKMTSDNGFILTGTRELSTSNHTIFLLKTDSGGGEEYIKTFGGTGLQRAEAIDIAPGGGYIITGSNEFEGNSMITLIKTKADGSL